MKTEITQIFYLPHCNSCNGEVYHCDNCYKHFEINPNTEQTKQVKLIILEKVIKTEVEK